MHQINNNISKLNLSTTMNNKTVSSKQGNSSVSKVVQEGSNTHDKIKLLNQIQSNAAPFQEDQVANQKCPFTFYSIGTSVMISSVRNLFTDFLESISTSNYRFKNGDSNDISAALKLIPVFSKTRLDILHPKINNFVSRPEELFEKMLKNQSIIIKGDLDVETFKSIYFGLSKSHFKEMWDVKGNSKKTCINLFSTVENQSNFEGIAPTPAKRRANPSNLRLDLVIDLQVVSIESIRKHSNQYTSLSISINNSSDLRLIATAFEVNSIIEIEIDFKANFIRFEELIEIIKKQSLKSLAVFQGTSIKRNILYDNFLFQLATTPFWKELEYLCLSNFSLEALLLALMNPLPKLQKIEFRNYYLSFILNESLKVAPISSVKEFSVILSGQCGKKGEIEKLSEIFPMAEKVVIEIMYELEAFEIKNNNLKEIQLRYRTMKNEKEFVNYLFTNSSILIEVKSFDGRAKWRKINERVFYEFSLENHDVPRSRICSSNE